MKVLFLNIDTIEDFMTEGGALYIEGADKIKPILSDITVFSVENRIPVVDICDCHTYGDPEISEKPNFKETFPPHAMKETPGGMMINETYRSIVYSRNELYMYVNKSQFDVFEGTSGKQIDEILSSLMPDIVVVYGVAADICVKRAAEGLLKRGIKTIIVNDAVVSINKEGDNDLRDSWLKRGAVVAKWSTVRSLITCDMMSR